MAAAPSRPGSSELTDLTGWAVDDHAAALVAFRRTCRRAFPVRLCRAAAAAPAGSEPAARAFFERWFAAAERTETGFLTGYFEPEVTGSITRDARFDVPLLGRPPGLVVRTDASVPPGWPVGLTAALRGPSGYAALPDRAGIEDGALGDAARPLVYLTDPVDAFTIHVQGSARIRLPDGTTTRVGFDGRNGHPYTPIARIVAEREGVPPSAMTADRLWTWLREHPTPARDVMRANRSFIFFRRLPTRVGDGPVGAAGVPLAAGRSLAVDPRATPYGRLVWLDGAVAGPDGAAGPLRRLVVAQDTGAAITGAARGDLFVGSGEAAGLEAGPIRATVRWWELQPRPVSSRRGRAR